MTASNSNPTGVPSTPPSTPAAPTPSTDDFVLEPPKPVAARTPEQAAGMVKLGPETLAQIDLKVGEFVDIVLQQAVGSEAFRQQAGSVHALGSKEIREAADLSNRLLERPVRAMNSGLFDEGSAISRTLLDLRHTVESLDPSRQGNLFEPKKLLGLIPWGRRIEDYFQQYQSSQTHLKAILEALHNGQDELRRDNAAIEEEKVHAWQVMERLEQYVVFGRRVDAALVARLADIDAADPEKGRVVREELLFYVRQKVQDLLTQLAVTIQGYLAMDMIRRNNLELIKGVDRASTSTISALRTAVIVAQALANQKLVLDQIGALNQTTGNLLVSTSAMLKSQAGQIHEQATSSAIGLDTLRESFRNVYDTIEMVSSYKLKALDTMQQTVESLDHEVRQAKTWLDRVRDKTVSEVRGSLDTLPAPTPPAQR